MFARKSQLPLSRTRRQKTRQRMKPSVSGPKKSEGACEKNMQRDADIQSDAERQHEKKPIEWIQQSGLKPAMKRRAAINVRIP